MEIFVWQLGNITNAIPTSHHWYGDLRLFIKCRRTIFSLYHVRNEDWHNVTSVCKLALLIVRYLGNITNATSTCHPITDSGRKNRDFIFNIRGSFFLSLSFQEWHSVTSLCNLALLRQYNKCHFCFQTHHWYGEWRLSIKCRRTIFSRR